MAMDKSMGTRAFPRAGTTQEVALERSYPAAKAEPLEGKMALDESFFTRNNGSKAPSTPLFFKYAAFPFNYSQCKKMQEELSYFKTAGSSFSEDFFKHFDSVYRSHTQMLEKLQLQRKKLDKKLRNVRAWRKVSNIIFVATFATVLICSVVAAAVISPHVAAAIAAAISPHVAAAIAAAVPAVNTLQQHDNTC